MSDTRKLILMLVIAIAAGLLVPRLAKRHRLSVHIEQPQQTYLCHMEIGIYDASRTLVATTGAFDTECISGDPSVVVHGVIGTKAATANTYWIAVGRSK